MKVAPPHPREAARLALLTEMDVLDTLSEQEYDDLTTLAATLCGTPVALVSLVDEERQWFKSRRGLDAQQTPRDWAFCAHAILQEGPFVVPDSLADERFHDNPLAVGAPFVRFYAGVPLQVDSLPMGTLCVIDHEARELGPAALEALEALGRQAESLLSLRLSLRRLEAASRLREQAEGARAAASARAEVAAEVLHDIGNAMTGLRAGASARVGEGWPELQTLERVNDLLLTHLGALEQLLGTGRGDALITVQRELHGALRQRHDMSDAHARHTLGVVEHVQEVLAIHRSGARAAQVGARPGVLVRRAVLTAQDFLGDFLDEHHTRLDFEVADGLGVTIDRTQLVRVLVNLIRNAVEAMEQVAPADRVVRVTTVDDGEHVQVLVADAGAGFAAADHPLERELPSTKSGHAGRGLRGARRVLRDHHGDLRLTSGGVGAGTTAIIVLPRHAAEPQGG